MQKFRREVIDCFAFWHIFGRRNACLNKNKIFAAGSAAELNMGIFLLNVFFAMTSSLLKNKIILFDMLNCIKTG